jgi:pilus assembly protein CpaE
MTQKKILIIDDEFPIRYLVEYQLSRKDYKVISAEDGPSGLHKAETIQPDLIVLDIMMPDMDGFQVCQEIRNRPEIAAIPIIFLSACTTSEHKTRAFQVGGDGYVEKPLVGAQLAAEIEKILCRSNQCHLAESVTPPGRVISFYSPKGGVGTTTLAIQLSEAIVLKEEQPVVLIDLDLPFGGVGPMLNIVNNDKRHVLDLLRCPPGEISEAIIKRYGQRHRANLYIVSAPSELAEIGLVPKPDRLKPILNAMTAAGYLVILDLGSSLSALTLEAMRLSHVVYVVTSGQVIANKLYNAFMSFVPELGLQSQRFLPVVNELHGAQRKMELSRMPVARIPHNDETSRTKLLLGDQGMNKLISVSV